VTVEPIVRRLTEGDWSGWPDHQVAARGKVTWKALQGVNDDENTDMVLGVARIFKGESLEAHRHLQPETYYVLSGKGKVTIEHVEYDVEADTMVYIPGDALHQINNYDEEPLRILYLFATPHFADVIYKF
jgi:mannose-6-phosphate isomerase-like protein (cupin superfamily)